MHWLTNTIGLSSSGLLVTMIASDVDAAATDKYSAIAVFMKLRSVAVPTMRIDQP